MEILPDGLICQILTEEQFRDSARRWEGAAYVANSSMNDEEIKQANKICEFEESRMKKFRHVFKFNDNGELIGTMSDQLPMSRHTKGSN